jgi:hypothetical protein
MSTTRAIAVLPQRIARGILYTQVAIHLVLPFTPVNRHEEPRIIVASLILGVTFLSLALWSYGAPRRAFSAGVLLLAVVIGVSHATGASPVTEGLVVKLLFLTGLGYGVLTAR